MRVAVVGAGGLVGRELLRELDRLYIEPWTDIELGAFGYSSIGREVTFRGRSVIIKPLEDLFREEWNVIFLMASSSVSEEIVSRLKSNSKLSDTLIIDNSSRYRLEPDVPLVVPEVNFQQLKGVKTGLIANPNCSTIQLVIPIFALARVYKINRVFLATYQSISGAGREALERFTLELHGKLTERTFVGNLIPIIGDVKGEFCLEERKLVSETPKILSSVLNYRFEVFPLTVRVPIPRCHAQAVWVEFDAEEIRLEEVQQTLRAMPGLKLYTDLDGYPMPRDVAGSTRIHVGRLRKLSSNLISYWSVFDNLLKGAAYNALQIAHIVLTGNPSPNPLPGR